MFVPRQIDRLIDELAVCRGVEAVVIGGSRALGLERADSDWDLGVYYRGQIDTSVLATHGTVFPPGSWGRIMNGGSWLTIAELRVDVLLRDLDALDHWTAEAVQGRFEIDGLPGYLAGIPTYSLTAEANVCRLVRGRFEVDRGFPEALRERAPQKWRFNRDFSLYHAATHAGRGNAVGALGQVARAVVEEAHARCCEASTWVLNEKHVVSAAGLDDINAALALADPSPLQLERLVDRVRAQLSR